MGSKSLSGYEKKKLYHNEGGQLFRDEAARHGLDSLRDGRGIVVADFDNDGRMDLFVTNANPEPYLYHNLLPTGAHWLELELEGRKSNRDAVGTKVWVTPAGGAGGNGAGPGGRPGGPPDRPAGRMLRFVDGGNGFAAQSTKRLHFGLGAAAAAEQVEGGGPSGLRQSCAGAGAAGAARGGPTGGDGRGESSMTRRRWEVAGSGTAARLAGGMCLLALAWAGGARHATAAPATPATSAALPAAGARASSAAGSQAPAGSPATAGSQ